MQMPEMREEQGSTAIAKKKQTSGRLMAFPTETKGLEAYAIARVSATGFTWSGDFDNLTSSETIVSSDWIGELYAR